MMKITSDRLSVLVAAVLSLASVAQAELRRVPQTYRTISAAIAASFDGADIGLTLSRWAFVPSGK